MKQLSTLFFVMFVGILGFAQQGINYKALITDDSGNVVANQNISVEFSILQGLAQTAVYTESHLPTTNGNGLIIINIGEGTPSLGSFSAIDWVSGSHFLNVKIDIGSGFTDMGTTEFKAVPYALNALTSKDNYWTKTGNQLYTIDDPVGIGNTNPQAQLDIKGGDWNLEAGNPGDLRIGNDDFNFRIGTATGGGGAGITRMYTNDNSLFLGTENRNVLTLHKNGNVGVNQDTPNGKLHIESNSSIGNPQLLLHEDGDDFARLNLRNNNTGHLWAIAGYKDGTDIAQDKLNFYNSEIGDLMTISGNGVITAPKVTNSIIESAGNKALVTKEFVAEQLTNNNRVAAKVGLNAIAVDLISFGGVQLNFNYLHYNFGGGIFNATDGSYTIPSTGVYSFDIIMKSDFDDAGTISITSRIYVNGNLRSNISKQYEMEFSTSYSRDFTYTDQLSLNGGDVVTYYVFSGFSSTGDTPRVLSGTTMSIYKVY